MNYPQIKPTLNLDFSNTKTLDPRINFRRGTPGAYYDGKTYTKAEENLIDYSEDFSEWAAGDGSLTPQLINDSNNTSPIGGNMYKLAAGTTLNTQHWYSSQNTTNNATFSVYAKAAGYNYIWIGLYDANYTSIVVDLRNGEFVSGGQDLSGVITDKNIVDVGDGWYRIDYSILSASIFTALGGLSDPSTDIHSDNFPLFTGDGTSGVYVWGAQLEQRDSVTAYTPTNGNPITKYQPKLMFASPDQPRFDHDVLTGESKGLLIEEQRTNLVTYSEDFSQWDRLFNVTVTSNTVVAPDGTLTGDLIIPSTSASEVFVGQESFGHPSSLYSTTFYVKYAGIQWIGLLEASGFGFVYFDILNGVVGDNRHDGIGTITSIGNGWFRCSVFRNTATTSRYVRIFLCDANGSNYCTASGIKGIYAWGEQLEEGSFPTSYIKTSGASATRSADNASITGENFSSWYRQDEGSLYCEAAKRDVSYSVVPVSVDGGPSDYIFLNLRSTESFEIKKNNSYQVSNLGFSNVDAETYHKIIGAYKKDNSAVSLNGIDALTDTDCEIPAINRLAIGSISGVAQNCHIKKLSYYPQRLTNEQLQQLTK
jgi:hypothetical protein